MIVIIIVSKFLGEMSSNRTFFTVMPPVQAERGPRMVLIQESHGASQMALPQRKVGGDDRYGTCLEQGLSGSYSSDGSFRGLKQCLKEST